MLTRKALYGLKSSGAAFRALLVGTLYDIGFVPTRADPDVWRRPAVKEDGFEYYEYVLCYVDDILAISHKAKDALKAVQAIFKLKDDRIEPPDMYLGATLSVMEDNGVQGWCMTSDKYIKAAVENVELELSRVNQQLPSRCKTPMDCRVSSRMRCLVRTHICQGPKVSGAHWCVTMGCRAWPS